MFHIRAAGQQPPAGDQDSEWEGELPNASDFCKSFCTLGWHIHRALHLGVSSRYLFPSGCELKLWIQSFNVGAKALKRNKTNHLVWVSHILVTFFGTPFKCHQQGSLSDMGMPPTWEKGSHLPPGITKLGNLRDSCDLSQLPLPNQIFRILLC